MTNVFKNYTLEGKKLKIETCDFSGNLTADSGEASALAATYSRVPHFTSHSHWHVPAMLLFITIEVVFFPFMVNK